MQKKNTSVNPYIVQKSEKLLKNCSRTNYT